MLAKEPDKPERKEPESEAPPARKPLDDKTVALLREAARRRRPWTLATWLLALLLVGGPIALVAWWVWPRPEPPRLVAVAFDQVVVQDEQPVCRAHLEPAEPPQAALDLSGQALAFEERPIIPVAGRKPDIREATAKADGSASVEWAFPAKERFEFTVRHTQPERRAEAVDRGRGFPWPKESKLLLVDVAALTENPEKLWGEQAVPNAPLLPGASAALRAARQAKFSVAYLAVGPRPAVAYRQVRNWAERLALRPDGIPDGPVLGSLSFGDNGDPQSVLALLKRFAGPHVIIVREAQAAEAYRAAGIDRFVVGQGGLTWEGVRKKLAR